MPGSLERGFDNPEIKLAVFSESEVYGRSKKQQARPRHKAKGKRITDYQELNMGDYVVHITHGIGKYMGCLLYTSFYLQKLLVLKRPVHRYPLLAADDTVRDL